MTADFADETDFVPYEKNVIQTRSGTDLRHLHLVLKCDDAEAVAEQCF